MRGYCGKLNFNLEDVASLEASPSIKNYGLRSILYSGYVWNVKFQNDGLVTAEVESDHAMRNMYKTSLKFGDHCVEKHSCTCKCLNIKWCKHRVGLVYASIILNEGLEERPKWVTRFPDYSRLLDRNKLSASCYEDVLRNLTSSRPEKMILVTSKHVKKARGRPRTEKFNQRLEASRPKDTRLFAVAPTKKRTLKVPVRLYDD